MDTVSLALRFIAECFVFSRQIEVHEERLSEPPIDHGLKRINRVGMTADPALRDAEIQIEGSRIGVGANVPTNLFQCFLGSSLLKFGNGAFDRSRSRSADIFSVTFLGLELAE